MCSSLDTQNTHTGKHIETDNQYNRRDPSSSDHYKIKSLIENHMLDTCSPQSNQSERGAYGWNPKWKSVC